MQSKKVRAFQFEEIFGAGAQKNAKKECGRLLFPRWCSQSFIVSFKNDQLPLIISKLYSNEGKKENKAIFNVFSY
jgi:hypothetical protein